MASRFIAMNILKTSRAFMSFDAKNKTHIKIDSLIKDSPKNVFLFMKGTPEEPACGFSKFAVAILQHHKANFDSFNVLEDDDIRRELKTYSDWPTIPQVFINKSFVGGSDILMQMHESGDLHKELGTDSESRQK